MKGAAVVRILMYVLILPERILRGVVDTDRESIFNDTFLFSPCIQIGHTSQNEKAPLVGAFFVLLAWRARGWDLNLTASAVRSEHAVALFDNEHAAF